MDINGEEFLILYLLLILIFFEIQVGLVDKFLFKENIFRFRSDLEQYKINHLKTPEDEVLFQEALNVLSRGEYSEVEVIFSDGQKSVFSTSYNKDKKVLKMGGTGM